MDVTEWMIAAICEGDQCRREQAVDENDIWEEERKNHQVDWGSNLEWLRPHWHHRHYVTGSRYGFFFRWGTLNLSELLQNFLHVCTIVLSFSYNFF